MPDVAGRYSRVAGGFTARLQAVGGDAWDSPSPCPDWNVRQLVTHVVNTHRRVLANLDGSEPVDVGALDDLGNSWLQASRAVKAALADPDRAGTEVRGMFGEQSFESLVGRLLCADTLVHTWDLARATGQDEQLDGEAVERARTFLGEIDEALRRPGGFGPKIASRPDADAQTEFLHFCGRRV